MKETKPFYKKFIFWLIFSPLLIGFIVFIPYFKFLFEYYVYNPVSQPAPEDFFVLSDKTPPEFEGLKAMPTEVVEVKADESDGTKTVEHHRDGYTLELPSYLDVSTWDFEPDRVMVIDPKNEESPCSANTYKIEDVKTVREAFDQSISYSKEEEKWGTYKITRSELEEIKDSKIKVKAFISHYANDLFGYQPSIYIQSKDEVFGISQNGMRYPECTLMMEVLKGFKINN